MFCTPGDYSVLSRSCGSGMSIHCHPVSGGGTAGVPPREDVRFFMFPQVEQRNHAEAGRTNRLVWIQQDQRVQDTME